jgi:hypothetical protein
MNKKWIKVKNSRMEYMSHKVKGECLRGEFRSASWLIQPVAVLGESSHQQPQPWNQWQQEAVVLVQCHGLQRQLRVFKTNSHCQPRKTERKSVCVCVHAYAINNAFSSLSVQSIYLLLNAQLCAYLHAHEKDHPDKMNNLKRSKLQISRRNL